MAGVTYDPNISHAMAVRTDVATTTVAGEVVPEGPLTKEQAQADTLRALKECFPDRWERIWHALGKESAADAAAAGLAKAGAANPAMALGAIIGGVIGAAVGSSAGGSLPAIPPGVLQHRSLRRRRR